MLDEMHNQPQGELTPSPEAAPIRLAKRTRGLEPLAPSKLLNTFQKAAQGLSGLSPDHVYHRTLNGLFDGVSTRELSQLAIRNAADLTAEDPQYARLAGRLLAGFITKELTHQGVITFSDSIALAHRCGLINDRTLAFIEAHQATLNAAIVPERDDIFEYFGLRTLQDRYFLRHPSTRVVLEGAQFFFMRIACGLANSLEDALEVYALLSTLEYLPSSPTLFNAGTRFEQLSSCFLLDSPEDTLESIYQRYMDVAKLSKFSGGVGIAYHRVRSNGSPIVSTNGRSNGIVPWLKTLDSSVAAVNQGGRRKGACCVYLEPWHPDIEAFLELRDNTGDEARRTHNLNLANWIPDLFMKRVEADGVWSLIDPKDAPELCDLWGEAFEAAYLAHEANGRVAKTVQAREIYGRMMRTLAQTGNGWMTFKDASNRACNQTAKAENVVHLSNLCTEIIEVSNQAETAVCNLGSVNLARHMKADGSGFDFDKLAVTVRAAVRQLDRVIDRNLYTIPSTKRSNDRWRPVGLGLMGLQDVFFMLRLPFDSAEARALSTSISEAIYFHALSASCELAQEYGAHPAFADTRAARGELQFDAWGVTPKGGFAWDALRESIKTHGLRNSLIVAIAPTATIASIAGCYECIEPQVSNLFKRETMSGDFLQINRYLVTELKRLGLWNDATRTALKMSEGSVANLSDLPEDLRKIYRTAWELPMRALIDMAAERGAFIDQSQSLNLFMESPNIGKLSSMYMYAWKRGLKTTYYLRSRPATKIAKATVPTPTLQAEPTPTPDEAQARAVACSLENPEACEACQ